MPPIKQELFNSLKKYATNFVETGTDNGETAILATQYFTQVYTIELDETKYKKCLDKFSLYPSITIIWGDSGEKLGDIVDRLNSKSVFFLDAHYDGVGSNSALGDEWIPISRELDAIKKSPIKDHIIIIDDFSAMDNNHFDTATKKWAGAPGIDALLVKIMEINPNYKFHLVACQDKLVCTTESIHVPCFGKNPPFWNSVDNNICERFLTDKELLDIVESSRRKNLASQIESLEKKLCMERSTPLGLNDYSIEGMIRIKLDLSNLLCNK